MKESPSLYRLGALVSQQIAPQDIPREAWPEIISLALQHGLAPMLLWVTKNNAPHVVTEPVWSPVITATRGAAVHHIILDGARKEVGAALNEAHIPMLWLKGIALAATVYPQPILRPMGDLDVLVPYEQRANALEIVKKLGYNHHEIDSPMIPYDQAQRLNFTHHYRLRGGMYESVVLELHYRLISADDLLLPLDKLEWFWTQIIAVRKGSNFTVLLPEAQLLYLSAHAILQHGKANTSLRQYFDLHQIITNTLIDWEKVIQQASILGWGHAIDQSLTTVAQYFPAPVPDVMFDAIRKTCSSSTASMRLLRKGARWERMWMRLQGLSAGQKIDLVFRILCPPKAYIRRRYNLRSGQPAWPYYLYRWFDHSKEMTWAMWQRIVRFFMR